MGQGVHKTEPNHHPLQIVVFYRFLALDMWCDKRLTELLTVHFRSNLGYSLPTTFTSHVCSQHYNLKLKIEIRAPQMKGHKHSYAMCTINWVFNCWVGHLQKAQRKIEWLYSTTKKKKWLLLCSNYQLLKFKGT